MKKIQFVTLFCISVLLLASCSEDESPSSAKQQVRFRLDAPGTIASESLVALDVTTSLGKVSEIVNVVTTKDGVFTEAIELPAGENMLTSFLVMDKDKVVTYASPRLGSSMAPAVVSALPQALILNSSAITQSVQVLQVLNEPASSFGYATFGITVVQPLTIAVFIEEDDKLLLTDASGVIHSGNAAEPLQQFALHSKVNYIAFDGDKNSSYWLEVHKPGFDNVIQEFKYADLEPKSLVVTLNKTEEPGFNFSFDVQHGHVASGTLAVGFTGSGSFTVHWGDGAMETVQFEPGMYEGNQRWFLHHYNTSGISYQAQARITGDLDKLTSIILQGNTSNLNLSVLPNLQKLIQHGAALSAQNLTKVDVSSNYKLRGLLVSQYGLNYELIIGENKTRLKRFKFVQLENQEHVLSTVEAHVVANNLMDGELLFWSTDLTPSSWVILNRLKNDYGWTIVEDHFGDGNF